MLICEQLLSSNTVRPLAIHSSMLEFNFQTKFTKIILTCAASDLHWICSGNPLPMISYVVMSFLWEIERCSVQQQKIEVLDFTHKFNPSGTNIH